MRVRAEEQPEKRDKKRHFWKAVDALRTVKAENVDFIVEPATLGIHDFKTLERLGKADEDEFKWDVGVLAACYPDVDITALRRATLGR